MLGARSTPWVENPRLDGLRPLALRASAALGVRVAPWNSAQWQRGTGCATPKGQEAEGHQDAHFQCVSVPRRRCGGARQEVFAVANGRANNPRFPATYGQERIFDD